MECTDPRRLGRRELLQSREIHFICDVASSINGTIQRLLATLGLSCRVCFCVDALLFAKGRRRSSFVASLLLLQRRYCLLSSRGLPSLERWAHSHAVAPEGAFSSCPQAERWPVRIQLRGQQGCLPRDKPHATDEPSQESGQAQQGRPASRFYAELEDLYDGGVDSAIFVLGLKKAIKSTPADALPFLRQLGHRLALLAFRLLRPGMWTD